MPDLANMFWIVEVYCCIMCFNRRKILDDENYLPDEKDQDLGHFTIPLNDSKQQHVNSIAILRRD